MNVYGISIKWCHNIHFFRKHNESPCFHCQMLASVSLVFMCIICCLLESKCLNAVCVSWKRDKERDKAYIHRAVTNQHSFSQELSSQNPPQKKHTPLIYHPSTFTKSHQGNEDALFIFLSLYPSKSINATRPHLFLKLSLFSVMEYLMYFRLNQVSSARREGPRIHSQSKQWEAVVHLASKQHHTSRSFTWEETIRYRMSKHCFVLFIY